jgi:hypothetical protein
MCQAEQPERERQTEGDRVDGIAHEAAGLERRLAVPRGDRAVQLSRRKREM